MVVENSATTIAPLVLRNIVTSIFIFADKPLVFLAEKHKILELIRYFLVSTFLFFLGVLPSLFPSLIPSGENFNNYYDPSLKHRKGDSFFLCRGGDGGGGGGGYYGGGDSGVARALSQLLSLVSDIPVTSRKYEVVRSLVEKLIDENVKNGNEKLREVNNRVLSAAFTSNLSQLEAAMMGRRMSDVYVNDGESEKSDKYLLLSQFLRGVGYYAEMLWRGWKPMSGGRSARKLAAESLWLAQKMSACGCVEEAVSQWASSSHLAGLALLVDRRIQSSLVKVSAFLFKQAKDIERKEVDEIANGELSRMKMNMLMLWLPLFCRGSNGTDVQVLTMGERVELEETLEDMVEELKDENEQEKVLSLWLQHFTHCPSSDWPNLQECYTRWYTASLEHLITQ